MRAVAPVAAVDLFQVAARVLQLAPGAFEHAFGFVERVIFVVGEFNLRSRAAMEKIGGRLTSRIIESATGTPGRHVVYAIDRDSFEAGPLKSVPEVCG